MQQRVVSELLSPSPAGNPEEGLRHEVERGRAGFRFSHCTASGRLEDSRRGLPLVVCGAAGESSRSTQSYYKRQHKLKEEKPYILWRYFLVFSKEAARTQRGLRRSSSHLYASFFTTVVSEGVWRGGWHRHWWEGYCRARNLDKRKQTKWRLGEVSRCCSWFPDLILQQHRRSSKSFLGREEYYHRRTVRT